MRTLGIDLAAQADKTAVCLLEWTGDSAVLSELGLGATDEVIVHMAERADVIGIDAPFGWPVPFIEFVGGTNGAPDMHPDWSMAHRDRLRFRVTDYRVREVMGRWPLSVSSDLIAVAAMRCVGLLRALGVADHSGDGRVFEVYPAVALNVWGLTNRGYKARGARATASQETLGALLTMLHEKCPWLTIPAEAYSLLARNDDAFDALVSALIARAARLGLTLRPTMEEGERARTEGWIAIPLPNSLTQLAVR